MSVIDFSPIEEKYGIKVPNDLKQYMEVKSGCVAGRIKDFDEVIILFKDGNSIESLSSMVDYWLECDGDIKKYIPIGITGYFAWNILMGIEDGKIYQEYGDNDGDVVSEPIADSLQDLLNRLEVIDLK